MRDMSSINLSSDLLNQRLAHPVILGPVGFAGMFSRRGCRSVSRPSAFVPSRKCAPPSKRRRGFSRMLRCQSRRAGSRKRLMIF
jgi:hypothetical protein